MSKPNEDNLVENEILKENAELLKKSKSASADDEKLTYIFQAEAEKPKRKDVIKSEKLTGKTAPKRRRHRRKHHSKKRKKKIAITVVCIVLAVIIALASGFFIFRNIGKKKMLNYNYVNLDVPVFAQTSDEGKTIEYNSKNYRLNENIISVLCVGVDKNINQTNTYGENGQADAVFLLTIDVGTGKTVILPINRDTLSEFDVYSASGKFIETRKAQLCLAYAYGKDAVTGSTNTEKAVSRLLYGIPVKHYVAFDLSSTAKINNICGGIKVTPNESFSTYGLSVQKGVPITLTDNQAKPYVQYRDQKIDNSNLGRMQRQKDFLNSAFKALGSTVKKDVTKVGGIYSSLNPYFTSNIGAAQATYLASAVLTRNRSLKIDYMSLDGKIKKQEGKPVFVLDEQKLFETVLEIFYIEE